MDAAQICKSSVWVLVAGLLCAAPGSAANLLVNGQTSVTVGLSTAVTQQPVSVTSSDGSAVSFTVGISGAVACGITWLGTTPTSGTTSATLDVILQNTLLTCGAAPYTATITLTNNSGGNNATITVTYSPNGSGGTTGAITVSPSPLTVSVASGSSLLTQVTLTNNSAGTVTFSNLSTSTSDGNPWLTASFLNSNNAALANGGTAVLNVTTFAFNLPTATYSGTISLNASSGQTITIQVTMAVNGATTGGLFANPASLTFASQNDGTPFSSSLIITTPAGGTYTAQSDSNWLFVSSAGSIPGTISVYASPATPVPPLAVGSYTGHVTIATSAGSQVVPVSLLVTASPVLAANPSVIYFNATTSTPTAQNVALSVSDNSSPVLTVSSAPSWATASITGNVLTVIPNLAGLNSAVYSGTIVVAANGVSTIANNPLSIPVVLVNGTGSAGSLTFSSSSVSFQGAVNSTPTSQSLTVSAATATTFTAAISSNANWLSLSPVQSSYTTNQPFTLSVNTTSLSAGTYNANLLFTAGGVTQTVPVTLTLSATGGNVTATPTSLTFAAQAGGSAPAAQTVTISNAASGTAGIPFTVSTVPANSWLTATPASATAQATVTVNANPSGLTPSSYNGTVQIVPTGGTEVDIPVTFSVQALPAVSVSNANVSFGFRAGNTTPATQTVTVSGGAFTALVTSTSTWLTVSPASGTAGSNLTIRADPTGLNVGQYQGAISVTGAAGATGTATINVSLSIQAPLPTITSLTNAASFLRGAISPGEMITLFGTDLGPSTAVTAQIDSSGKLATTLSGVQVLVNGFPAPIVNAINTQVSAMVPYEVAGFRTASVLVKYLGQTSNAIPIAVTGTAPGLFTLNQSGTGPALAFDTSSRVVSSSNPVAKGSYVSFFLTGEGQTSPPGVTGTINPLSTNLPSPVGPVAVLIDNQPANFNYAGGVPQTVEGFMQLNVLIPQGVRSGDVPVTVTIGSQTTQPGVTVSVQ